MFTVNAKKSHQAAAYFFEVFGVSDRADQPQAKQFANGAAMRLVPMLDALGLREILSAINFDMA